MATIPIPRSYSQIVGDMNDAFLSRFGIPALKVGGPPLAIIEAAAQSDLRVSQDIFQSLAADSLDRAEGTALDRIGNDEDTPRFTETPSSGFVNVNDPTFTKTSTKIFSGLPAPIAGSAAVYVLSALSFPSTGSIYIGRNTVNYEGPLVYTAKTNLGNYWRLDLDTGSKTTKFHNQNESVVLAQGGNRVISAGSVAQTPQGNVSQAIQFTVQFDAQIPDGENQVINVQVIANKPGITGNIPAGLINSFSSPPFNGAQVTNPTPFTNAQPKESDKDYRERIRNTRASRTQGTDLAITNSVLGITSADEPKRVVSSTLVRRQGLPSTLYIDDGTGYEEIGEGIAQEVLIESAFGGEQYFQVSSDRPVTRAFVATSLTAPFTLASGMTLAVKVGGVLQKHTFNGNEFIAITNASAYEVVASINGDPALDWSARTLLGGTMVAVFGKPETNEDVEVTTVDTDEVDANEFLGFSTGRADTMRLYKNDLLLNKDGREALIESNSQAAWASMAGSQTLIIQVDNTPATTYTFTDSDFVNAETGFATLSQSNSLDAWVAVFNAKISGITAVSSGGKLIITSNLGANDRAAIIITGGTMVSGGKMFTFNTATALQSLGEALDYTLDRNTGQLSLQRVLGLGDRLTIGSASTRAFVQSAALTNTTLANDGQLWFIVDGQAQLVPSGLVSSSTVGLTEYDTTPPQSWGDRMRCTCASAVFLNVKVGDWAILLDTNINVANRGAWRVATVDPSGFFFEVEVSAMVVQLGIVLNQGGITFVRSSEKLQHIVIPAASNYTAATFVDSINSTIRGATATVYNTNKIRVRTDTFDESGDIALVAQNADAQALGFATANALPNRSSHLASIISGNREDGTPNFSAYSSATISGTNSFLVNSTTGLLQNHIVKFLRNKPDVDSSVPRTRFGSNKGYQFPISINYGSSLLTTRYNALGEFVLQDRFYASHPPALSALDNFAVVVDGDVEQERYVIPMYRRGTPTSNTYGTTITLTDTDNAGASLAAGFGTSFDFKDFTVYMKSRIKSHAESNTDTTKTILWRFNRYGAEGNVGLIRYAYPTAAGASVAVSTEAAPTGLEGNFRVNITLPSGAARSGQTIRNSTRIGVMAATSGSLQSLTYLLGFSITSAIRYINVSYSGRGTTAFGGTITGGTSGATGTVISDSTPGGISGGGIVTIADVTGVFLNGESLTATAGAATAASGPIGLTVITPDLGTPGATNHGFNLSAQVWIQSTNGLFSSGLKTITILDPTTFGYVEGTTTASSTPNIGTVSNDPNGEATFNGSTVAVNDIASIGANTSLPTVWQRAGRISALANQYWKELAETSITPGTVPTWFSVNDVSNVQFYPINTGASTAAAIAAAVNSLASAANSTCPVTAVAVGLSGVATGVISKASFDDFTTVNYAYAMTDGVNYVDSTNTPANTSVNFQLTLKNAISAALATNADWANEEIHLVPTTLKNIVDYLNTLAVSGLGSVAEVAQAGEDARIQIASNTLGSGGSVQCQGGTANSLTSLAVTSALNVASTYSLLSVKKADVDGLAGGMWVDLENLLPMPKAIFTSATSLSSLDTSGNFVLTGTQAWTYANSGAVQLNSSTWQVEKQGRYTAFVWDGISSSPTLTGIQEGDWVIISGGTLSSPNTGQFRVVRVSNTLKTFWVENPNSIEEIQSAHLWFVTYDSIMPGDQINISTALWGSKNMGIWTVESIDNSGVGKFKVKVTDKHTTAFTGPQTLGTSASLVQCFEGVATKLVKQIRSICTNNLDSTLVDVKFESFQGYRNVGPVAQSTLIALDKLNFPADLAQGIDGYQHSVGLIGEAARILYGLEDDPATYPGVVASGSNVNMSGPLVKRIQVAVAIRTRVTGVVIDEVKARVRSAIASVVNRSKVGQPIAIDDIISAAKSVNGVIAVTMLSPTYSVGNDLISLQPFEKALILNLDQDIQVSLIGE